MKDHGFREVAIDSIVIDAADDVKARMVRPDVIELAASRKKIALHPVTVDVTTNRLIAGRDRMAADLLNKAAKVKARFVEGTAAELQDIEDDENIRRRHGDRDAAIARKVNRTAGGLPVTLTANSARQTEEVRAVGRPKTTEGKAREQVAKAAGTSPEAVRSAVRRTRPAPEPTSVAPPPIALHGCHPTNEWLEQVRAIQEQIDAADRHGRAMHAALTALEIVRFPPGLLQGLKRELHAVTAAVRAARPRSICKSCGGNGCGTCNGVGWVAEEFEVSQESRPAQKMPADVVSTAPASAGEKPAVSKGAGVARGTPTTEAPAPPKPNALKLTVVMPDGSKFGGEGAPADDDDIPF